jgi:hypothetical protein
VQLSKIVHGGMEMPLTAAAFEAAHVRAITLLDVPLSEVFDGLPTSASRLL